MLKMNLRRKLVIGVICALISTSIFPSLAFAEEKGTVLDIPSTTIKLVYHSNGYPMKVTVAGTFGKAPDGFTYLCLIGKDPNSPKTDSKECFGIAVHSDAPFNVDYEFPAKYNLEAQMSLFSPLTFTGQSNGVATVATIVNDDFLCQKNKTCKPETSVTSSASKSKSSNVSRYTDGYKLINASPAALKAAGFYGYFSSNKKMSKANATRFCQYYVRQASLRTDYFDGFGTKEMSTFIQGCAAAAVKIPYGK